MLLEIRPGEGGDDAAVFAKELLDAFRAIASRSRFTITTAHDAGRTLRARVPQKHVEVIARFVGTHRIQRIPRNDTRGRRHTSTATVALVDEATPVDIAIREADISVSAYRASGPGGQHRNKTWSACRIKHHPSGLVVTCADERHFDANRKKALAVLRERLTAKEHQRASDETNAQRVAQFQAGDRPAKSFTHNDQRGEVRCHDDGQVWRASDWRRGRIR